MIQSQALSQPIMEAINQKLSQTGRFALNMYDARLPGKKGLADLVLQRNPEFNSRFEQDKLFFILGILKLALFGNF